MCSIFHNRINYRGLRSNSNGSSNSNNNSNSNSNGSLSNLTKELDADRNNNNNNVNDLSTSNETNGDVDGEMTCQDDCKAKEVMSLKGASLPTDRVNDDEKRETKCKMRATNDEVVIGRLIEDCEDDEEEVEMTVDGLGDDSNEALDLSVLPGNQGPVVSGHVAFEALQNTKVAVAQFAASALSNAHNHGEEINELLMVQSTILNVQRQHLMQLQLIQHLQSQLKRASDLTTDSEQLDDTDEVTEQQSNPELKKRRLESQKQDEKSDHLMAKVELKRATDTLSPHSEMDCAEQLSKPSKLSLTIVTNDEENKKTDESKNGAVCKELGVKKSLDDSEKVKMRSAENREPKNNNNYQPLMCDISSSLASTIITNHDPPPAPNEPNCLEMLQRRTEEVLDSASQSLHASHLQDEYEYAQKDAQGRGEIFKHRCKYCGKIFGSFSALQIHLRSHTGERPFHCNVCGSKFTTKGNLKVHYQRHTQIFPPMLLAHGPSGNIVEQQYPPYGPPVSGALIPGVAAPIRLPVANEFKAKCVDEMIVEAPLKEIDEELTKTHMRGSTVEAEDVSSLSETPQNLSTSHSSPFPAEIPTTLEQPKSPRTSPITKPTIAAIEAKLDFQECASTQHPTPQTNHQLSKRSSSSRKRSSRANTPHSVTTSESRKSHIHEERDRERLGEVNDFASKFTTSHRRCSLSRNSSNSGLEPHISSEYSLAQMERIIDKSWEDLIEIDTTSETSKLQQLVDNIENKLTDPNQCIFCHKVMSCRSSLQMHIRTHTGERPFRCKICGRAFATKGNLKAHMSIHKIKPPMRSQSKCPVCHQKFSNGVILQQHIRIHTIDDGSGILNGLSGVALNGGVLGAFSLPLGTLPGTPAAAEAVAEHNARIKAHMEAVIEDQNSNKSMCTSENFDFSTTSDYSGQRSESSQGDYDDFMTMDSTDDSRENTSSLTPFDRRLVDDYAAAEERANEATERGENCDLTSPMAAMAAAAAMDLTARGFPQNGVTQKALEHMPMLGMPPNFLLMAAAREEMQMLGAQGKFPLLPFGPLGFMGLHHQTHLCNLCFRIFPNSLALERHTQTDHTKDVGNNLTNVQTTTATTTTAATTTTTTTNSESNHSDATTSDLINKKSPSTKADRTTPPPFNAKLTVSSHLFPKKNSDDLQNTDRTKSLNNSPGTYNQNNLINLNNSKSAGTGNPEGNISPTFNDCIKQEPETEDEHELENSKEDISRSPLANATDRTSTPTNNNTSLPRQAMPILPALRSNIPSTTNPSNNHSEQLSLRTTHSPFELPLHSQLTMPPQSNAEQSLMQMQLHAHRFPASPLDFQQALMSVGPPSLSSDPAAAANQKHFCHVCRRNFSSSSALQIHMRTHTGDKPFQCNVCQKAFTTKGNLKVHMGTHMWTNPTSRRGRRMSLELPLHRPGSMPAESDLMQRRPELFFPYLPPFFNGLPLKPGDLSPGAFPTLTPPIFPNGANTAKYQPGLLGLPPFLAPPYNFAGMTSQAHGERTQGESTNKSPSLKHDEAKRVKSPTRSMALEAAAPWHMLDKIKKETNQNDETTTTPAINSSQLDETRNETQRLVD